MALGGVAFRRQRCDVAGEIERYGIEIKSESEENHRIFQSLRALAEFVAAMRTK